MEKYRERLKDELWKIYNKRCRFCEKGLRQTKIAHELLDSALEICDELDRLDKQREKWGF